MWRRGPVDGITVGGETIIVHTPTRARLRARGGRLQRAEGYASAPPAARRELARVGAMVQLRERGRFHLHAAGIVAPDGRAWILAGDSGSGKSTLAYAAARAGWPLLGDDGVVIERVPEGVRAHAWREPVQLSIELAEAFPELRAHAAHVNWSDPRHRAPVPATFVRHAPVAGVVFVRRGERDALAPVAPTAALARLVRQSPMVLIGDERAADHLAALQALAGAVPAFELEHTSAQLHRITRTIAGACA